MTAPISTLIVDDHAPFRAGVRLALDGRGFRICGEAANAREAVALAVELEPDLCLLDVDMPGDGLVAAAEIARRSPRTAIVMMTVSEREDDLLAAIRAGAKGYLLKDTPASRLPSVLRAVVAGEAAMPRRLVARLMSAIRAGEGQPGGPLRIRGVELTPREWAVLQLLRRRETTEEIAATLGIAPVTVRTHVSALLGKFGVVRREDLLGLFDVDER